MKPARRYPSGCSTGGLRVRNKATETPRYHTAVNSPGNHVVSRLPSMEKKTPVRKNTLVVPRQVDHRGDDRQPGRPPRKYRFGKYTGRIDQRCGRDDEALQREQGQAEVIADRAHRRGRQLVGRRSGDDADGHRDERQRSHGGGRYQEQIAQVLAAGRCVEDPPHDDGEPEDQRGGQSVEPALRDHRVAVLDEEGLDFLVARIPGGGGLPFRLAAMAEATTYAIPAMPPETFQCASFISAPAASS